MTKRIYYLFLALLIVFVLFGIIILNFKSADKEKTNSETSIVENLSSDYFDGQNLFNENCSACHSLNRKSTPDFLIDLDSKMDKSYFHKFITKQDSLVKNNDKYITEMGSYPQYKGILAIAHTFNELSEEETILIYDYIIHANSR